MHRLRATFRSSTLALASCLAIACSDVGDDMGGGAGEAPAVDASEDGLRPDATGGAAVDAHAEAGTATDATIADSGPPDATSSDTTAPDTSVPDTSVQDTSIPDTSAPDTDVPDTNVPDTNAPDTNVPDTNAPDVDVPDTSVPDAGAHDATAADGGAGDSGADAGVSPCASSNGGAGCTPTEQRLVDHSPACYQCMVQAGCLDDVTFNDTGHECGDVTGSAAHGARAGTSRATLCLETLDCILAPPHCAADDVNICYCGALGAGNGCATGTAPDTTAACFQKEVDGLEHLATDAPSAVLPDYTDLARGAGMANQLLVCAKTNACDVLCAQ